MTDKPVKISAKDKTVKVEVVEQDELKASPLSPTVSSGDVANASSPVDSSSWLKQQPKSASRLKRLFWPSLFTFVAGAAIYESYLFIQELFSVNSLLGLSALAVAGLAVVSGSVGLVKGWLARRKLKKRSEQQQSFQQLIEQDSYGQSQPLIDSVNQEIGEQVNISGALSLYQQQKQQVHNDRELIQLYSQTVLEGLDKIALERVTKHATESALMVALSPLAAVDMALVAWRSSKMLQDISTIYGCPQTVMGRFSLTRQVLNNMMIAGASDMLADAGAELLGKSLTATISTKAAQGIGVGLLIARMGIQTMQLCRPVAFNADNRPKLGYIRKVLYNKVVGRIKNGQQDNNSHLKGERNDRN